MDIHEKINIFLSRLKNSSLKIAVFGDSVLDEYYNVDSSRISPEFPIPISLTSEEEPIKVQPGGAGNVCRQFLNYANIDIELYSLLDIQADQYYVDNGINTNNCIILTNSKIPRKKRFYNGSFPLFRWDVEKKDFGIKNIKAYQDELFEKLLKSNSQACIFSDYGKGVFSNDRVYEFDCSVVDPKYDPIKKWENCFVFKPNRSEAFNLSKKINPVDQCRFFKEKIKCKNILVTDSYKGFYGIDEKDNFFEYESFKKETKASVIGGGDCFISYLTLGLILGFDLYDSAQVSFNLSYYYVTDNNNINLSYFDFYKILNEKHIEAEFLKNRNFKITFTNGCFDAGLTPGHIDCLKFAKKQGNKVVVALNGDTSIRKIKGKNRPIMSLEERIEIVSSLEFVDYIISFEEETPESLIKEIKPELIVKGGDYKEEDVVGKDYSKVLICPKRNCLSTTDKLKWLNLK